MTSCMGRVIWWPSLLRSTTVLTWPSRPFRSSSMRARPHKCLGRTSSCIRTTSPRRSWAVFPTGRWTSWKFLSSNKYSFVQRSQKSSESFCFSLSSLAKLVQAFVRMTQLSCNGLQGVWLRRGSECLPCYFAIAWRESNV